MRVLEHYEEVIVVGEEMTAETRMLAASAPEPLIDRCYVGVMLLAYLVASRFADHIPYYREEDILSRVGFPFTARRSGVGCGPWPPSCFRWWN